MEKETIKITLHPSFLADTEDCADRSEMLLEEYILAAIREKNKTVKN